MIFLFSSFEREIEPASSLTKCSSSNFNSCFGTFTVRFGGSFVPSWKFAGVVSSGCCGGIPAGG